MSKNNDNFYNLETLGGLLLFFSAIMAIIIANSSFYPLYDSILHTRVMVGTDDFFIRKQLILWINDGLMAIYFLLIGLEIKREIRRGADSKSIIIPAICAACGLIFPALIFFSLNYKHTEYLQGWAIPTATDIAFSLGVVSLLSSRVPVSLKILLTAIAIFDDIAAIVIIAVFYTSKLSPYLLAIAFLFMVILIAMNYFNVKRPSLYVVVGIALWTAVLKSGVHATLAGIVIAMTIPDNPKNSLLERMEHGIHPWVVFLILPAFAFANAGIRFIGLDAQAYFHPIVLGIAFGLFFGKQIGIFLPLAYFYKFKGYLKDNAISLMQLYGIALTCGIGFTMSLFIGTLAYSQHAFALMPMVKLGVIVGSFLSGLCGFLVLKQAGNRKKPIPLPEAVRGTAEL